MKPLAVDSILDALSTALKARGCAILEAPPGAGKTTRVPPGLLDRDWLDGRRILMLEPRRLATRAAAARMAAELGERVGRTVGYRMRLESRVGPDTRIEVVTEGVMTRMLQRDPSLEGVGLVIFDEFHERSLPADLALALCLDVQGVLNDSLRLLAMSATPDTEALSRIMNRAPVLRCGGRPFPVETRYVGPGRSASLAQNMAAVIRGALGRYPGSILAFLPGIPEIRKVQALLDAAECNPGCRVLPLYGNLAWAEQQLAIAPAPTGRRKVVLATDIAETSLTIEGIGVVVDGGWRRAPIFDVSSGMTRLATQPISRASADQRRGRAGRLGPGVCLRMWAADRQALLAPHNRPEILETDLTPLALELAVWGAADHRQLKWIDPPPEAAMSEARRLLGELGALDVDPAGPVTVTPHGRRMADLAVHPRLAHMLLMAREAGAAAMACRLAAILSERDVIHPPIGGPDADLRLRLEVLAAVERGAGWSHAAGEVDGAACGRVLNTAKLLERRLHAVSGPAHPVSVGRLLAWAYPDRIARRRSGSRRRYLLANGRGAAFTGHEPLTACDYLVVAGLDGDRREARIHLAAGYDAADLEAQYGHRIREVVTVAWDASAKAVDCTRRRVLGALTIERSRYDGAPADQVRAALIDGIRREGIDCLPWTRALRSWQQRVLFMRRLEGDGGPWPDVSDGTLLETLDAWLGRQMEGITRLRQLGGIDLKGALRGLMPWACHERLDRLAPTHLSVPSGARVPVDYGADPPVAAVRIQQMFGAVETPRIGGGRQPLVLHLLSPAGRPMQITTDLAGFWKNSYHDVKKELRARYPKHPWPDDPLAAAPTDRARPRGQGPA